MIIPLFKPIGPTTHQFIQEFAQKIGEKCTHTGSLDPMASGIVVALTGEDRFLKGKLPNSNKKYQVEILLGFSTDTHDLLGVITSHSNTLNLRNALEQIVISLLQSIGTFEQRQPSFSAFRKNGLSGFDLAKQDVKLELPTNQVTIHIAEVKNVATTTINKLLNHLQLHIPLVRGDFRQEEIVEGWEQKLSETSTEHFPLITIEATCSKRTYMRSLVRDISQATGIPLTCFHISRISDGGYTLAQAQANSSRYDV